MILLLAAAGGGLDAVIISGFQVLTGAQTGNTVLLAVALAEGRFATGFYAALSVAAFVIGSVVGQSVILQHRSASALTPIGWALLAELVPLGALLVSWHLGPSQPGTTLTAVLVGFAAISMGIQSAAVLRLHGSPTTTYVTGTLTAFGTELTRWIFIKEAGQRSSGANDPARSGQVPLGSGPILYGIDLLVYLGGGVATAVLFLSVREMALVLPIVAVVAVILAGGSSRVDILE